MAVASFTIGVLAGAFSAVGDDAPVTRAALFGPTVIDLVLEGDGGASAFIGGENLAPGDRAQGTLRLFTDSPATRRIERETLDLDFHVRVHADGADGGARFADAHVVTRLAYGFDDLLDAGGRDLVAEIDGHPAHGDGDGRLTLRELEAGANDLPPPFEPQRGGTPLVVELAFRPPADWDCGCGALHASFVFVLADVTEPDLN